MKLKTYITIALCLVGETLCGCRDRQITHQLDAAEALMEERPDSALAMLHAIDSTRLAGEPQARYALLKSQALDKNHIDVKDDSLITIATNYYSGSGNLRYEMLANYYQAIVYFNDGDNAQALTFALEANRQADAIGDTYYLTRSEYIIANAYLFSHNKEGAEEYFYKALAHTYELNMPQWIGITYSGLANLHLIKKDFDKVIEYADSTNVYLPGDKDVAELYMLASIGQENYTAFDSIYSQYSKLYPNNLQMKAYSILSSAIQSRNIHSCDSIYRLMDGASRFDSVELAGVGKSISLQLKDYYSAWYFADISLNETNRVLSDISGHSLYRIQINHEKSEAQKLQLRLRHREQTIQYLIIIAILVVIIFVFSTVLINKKHREDLLKAQNQFLLLSADYSKLQKSYDRETSRLKEAQRETFIEINNLNSRIQQSQLAGQELFMQRFSWIEELGNIFLDAETSKINSNRVLKDIKKRLDTVKSKKFLLQLIDIVNHYRNNILGRIKQECPWITEAEIDILALLCANLSPRIIGFILNILPQSVYNAKSSIKRKISASATSILDDLSDIYPH